jgi:para-nitrobenzyl esterase
MRLKLLSIVLTCAAWLLAVSADAQCSGPRYVDSIFANYTITTVTYSTVYNQQMDIYQPVGDQQVTRPVVVLAHGGSFTSGTRTDDNAVTQLCIDLVHKGYVTVSIDYRLTATQNLLIADSAILAVLEAVSDGKAAVRYLYMDAQTSNTFKIDTNNIFIGGNSAGAVLFMHYAYIDSVVELNSNFQAILANIGGLQGNSGNPGYSTNFKGVINLAGALNEPSWIGYCSKPVVSAQGTADPVVPYNCGNPEYGVVPVTLCGLDSMQPYITANTPYSASMIFPGAGHVPWQSDAGDFYMIDTMITNFLFKAVGLTTTSPCGTTPATCNTYVPDGIQPVVEQADINLFPNPGSNVLNIHSSQYMSSISMSDEMGRIVFEATSINTTLYQINTSHLSTGVYFVHINDAAGRMPVVRKVIIE